MALIALKPFNANLTMVFIVIALNVARTYFILSFLLCLFYSILVLDVFRLIIGIRVLEFVV